MRILVPGGAGYIGSHTVRTLIRHGHDVVVYDNFSTGHREFADGIETIDGDIGDRTKLSLILRGVDAVMHFAAYSRVGESIANPEKYFENNLRSGLALLGAVLEAQTPYFILSSTCAVYGVPASVPIDEDSPRAPINPYGVSKLALEQALEAYRTAYGLRYINLRYFNAAGADESSEIGELHQPETHLIPCALEAAAGLRSQIEVYGLDYPTADGTCVRDYVHVSDLAEAHLLALEYLADGGQPGSINLGGGRGHSVLEVLSAVEAVTGSTLNKQSCPRRPGDPPVLVADPQHALQLLDWRPQRSLLDMVSSAWNWMQSNRAKTLRELSTAKGVSEVAAIPSLG